MSYASYKNIGIDKAAPSPESMGNVPEIETVEQRKNVIMNYPLVIIDNFTTWCGPCKTATPKFAQLAKIYSEKGVVFLKENVEKNLADCPPITGVPCFHFYIEGKFMPNLTITGAAIDQIEATINDILNSQRE